MTVSNRQIGNVFERHACQLLRDNHLSIVATNYIAHHVGEIDIIAMQQNTTRCSVDTLICVEVKARRHSQFGQASHSVGKQKQKRLIRTMLHFISEYGYDTMDVRFDVIAFDVLGANDYSVEWIQGAFLAEDF